MRRFKNEEPNPRYDPSPKVKKRTPMRPSVVFDEYTDDDPGPGQYFRAELHNSMGRQYLSNSQSAPAVRFSTTGRDAWSRVLISKSHSEVGAKGKEGAPPGSYNLSETTLGSRTSEFSKYKSNRPDPGKELPGVKEHPGAIYNVTNDYVDGAVSNSQRGGLARNIVFGTSKRFEMPGNAPTLGPGEYGVPTGPSYVVPKTRDTTFGAPLSTYSKALIHPNTAKVGEEVLKGRESSGPGALRKTDLNEMGYRFQTAKRFPRTHAEKQQLLREPGPGEYRSEIVKQAIRTEPSYLSDLPNPISPAFGSPSRRPRINPKALLQDSSDMNRQLMT
jgi:hypothetical protein